MSKFFWDNVNFLTDDECWEWTLSIMSAGYGQVQVEGKKWLAHRRAWVLEYGPIPNGLHVLHHCDNKICVRPAHLFLGTAQDNADDMICKGRHNVKITDAEVVKIRDSSEKAEILGMYFGVHPSHIRSIRNGRRRSV